ncbi:MAG: nitroreductase family protein [Minisyncoccia bacterium]
MDAIKAIKERRSIREYLQKPIPKEILEDIVDCARLAPSGNNAQPWHFIVITNKEKLKFISEKATHGSFIKNAAACIIVYCESDNNHHLEDGSAATQNILLAAKAYGIGSCWVAGYNRTYEKDINQHLNIPENLRMISIISLGYPLVDTIFKSKFSLNQVLHWENF